MRTIRCISRLEGSPRGLSAQGGVCPGRGGVCLPRGVCLPNGDVCLPGDVHLPLWREFLTHACENITFPQIRLRMVTRQQWTLSWMNYLQNVIVSSSVMSQKES